MLARVGALLEEARDRLGVSTMEAEVEGEATWAGVALTLFVTAQAIATAAVARS